MRNKSFYIAVILALLLLSFTSCSSRENTDSTKKISAELESAIDNQYFSFSATKAYPSSPETINLINNFRPQGSAFQLLNLNSGYGFSMKKNDLKIDMPYFGRAFNPIMDVRNQGLKFESKDFTVTKKEAKGKVSLTIKPNDLPAIDKMFLDVYNSGAASLSVSLTDRQPISYDGFVKVYGNKSDSIK